MSTMPSTTFHPTKSVTEQTFNRRLDQLIREVMQHPYKDELLKLAHEQLADDTFVLTDKDA